MINPSAQRIHRVSALILLTSVLFTLFFQVSKNGPFRQVNPFLNDPYDVVGSIAVQLALVVGLLSYARSLRWRNDTAQGPKAPLILRGNGLVLLGIFVTMVADLIAEIKVPVPPSYWGNLLRIGLAGMFLLIFICAIVLLLATRAASAIPPPPDLTLADAIDDLWSLVRLPVIKAGSLIPPRIVEWVKHMNSDWLFARMPAIDPRKHSWRFACAIGITVGVLLILGQLQEGLPPNAAAGVLVFSIFISVELVAALAGFAIFGGYLGLRPKLF